MYSVRRAYEPFQVEQCELSEGLAAIRPRALASGEPYRALRLLVRLHSYPLGVVDLPLPAAGLEPAEIAAAIDACLGSRVREHLRGDGIDVPADLAGGGIVHPAPPCQAGRRAALADPPLVSVVVPTRGRPELAARCVDSVLGSEYPDGRLEVVVADNAPPDSGTRDLVEQRYGRDERVRYVLSPRPGSGSARNDGAERAAGELVAFVDDDALVDRVWLAELVAGFRAAADVSCVTGLVLAAELDTPAQHLFEEYGGMGKGFQDAVYDLGAHRPPQPIFPFNAATLGSGNNIAFRRRSLLDAGGYDADLGNGTPARAGEDWELFLRLLRHGHTVAYRPGAIVHHTHRRELGELCDQIHDYGVGLSAALTRTVVREPAAVLEIARRLPRGLWFLLSPRSAKNRNWSDDYPRELRRAELRGLARGPAAYARSRRQRA
jgi:glycosyltransferase involved in cell wall biosynthesis